MPSFSSFFFFSSRRRHTRSFGDWSSDGCSSDLWPPFFSLVCVPLALVAALAPAVARGLWVVVNYGAVLLAVGLIVRLLYGEPLSLRAAGGGVSLAAPAV